MFFGDHQKHNMTWQVIFEFKWTHCLLGIVANLLKALKRVISQKHHGGAAEEAETVTEPQESIFVFNNDTVSGKSFY